MPAAGHESPVAEAVMLKMEWRNTLKAGIICLGLLIPGLFIALLKIPAAGLLNFVIVKAFNILNGGIEQPYLFLLLFLLSLTILVTANVLGFNAFRSEHEDQAFEYLFTFPVSKRRILADKLIPRLLTLGGLLSVHIVASLFFVQKLRPIQGKLFFLIDPVFFPVVVLVVFFSGFLIGIYEQKNLVSVVTLLSFLSLIALPSGVFVLLKPIFPDSWELFYKNGLAFTVGALLLLFILGVSALSTFGRMDLRSLPSSSRTFAWRALWPLGILCLGSFLLLILKK
jgi:ABC-type transport system involved in multi-copper enzyme maturation permease subunit